MKHPHGVLAGMTRTARGRYGTQDLVGLLLAVVLLLVREFQDTRPCVEAGQHEIHDELGRGSLEGIVEQGHGDAAERLLRRDANSLVEILRLPRDADDPARRHGDNDKVNKRELPVVEERFSDDRAALAQHEESVQSCGGHLILKAAPGPTDEIQHDQAQCHALAHDDGRTVLEGYIRREGVGGREQGDTG